MGLLERYERQAVLLKPTPPDMAADERLPAQARRLLGLSNLLRVNGIAEPQSLFNTSPGPMDLPRLFSSRLATDTASIDTGANLPGGYAHLLVVAKMRTDQAAVSSLAQINFNGDSGANYDRFAISWSGSSIASGSAYAQTTLLMDAVGASADANRFTTLLVLLVDYSDTGAWKQALVLGGGVGTGADANVRLGLITWTWRSTSALNRIVLANNGGTVLKTGSSLSVYGLE